MLPSPRSRHACCRGVYHLPPVLLALLLLWAYGVALVDVTVLWHYRGQQRAAFALAMGAWLTAIWVPAISSLFILTTRGPGFVDVGSMPDPTGESEPFLGQRSGDLRVRSPPKRYTALPDGEGEDVVALDDDAKSLHQQVPELVHSASKLVGFDDGQRHGPPNEGFLTAKANGRPRFCRKCAAYKPDRSHHCSTCGRCTLQLDHHCPAVAVDVGHRNRKAFVLFLSYSTLFSATCAIYAGLSLYDFMTDSRNEYAFAPLQWAFLLIIGAVFALALGGFSSYHLYLVGSNRTTLEAMESTNRLRISAIPPPTEHGDDRSASSSAAVASLISYAEQRRLEREASAINIFDLGWRANMAQVFGPVRLRRGLGLLAWILPFGPVRGDGRSWPVNDANVARLERIVRQLEAARSSRNGGRAM